MDVRLKTPTVTATQVNLDEDSLPEGVMENQHTTSGFSTADNREVNDGDWIISEEGNIISVVSDEDFNELYEEVEAPEVPEYDAAN